MTRKQSNKLDRPIHEIAQLFAVRLISSYSIIDAERIALLTLEKIRANRKGLETRYGKE